MIPTDNEIAEQNIERLLGAAYKPETPDPIFAQTVTEYLCSVGKELAEKQPSQPASDAHRYRALRRRLGWGMAAAACVAICALVIYARTRPGSQVVQDSPKGEHSGDMLTKPLSGRETASNGLVARTRPAGPKVKPLALGERLSTKAGERRRLTLADGTILYLNQNSEVTQTAARRLVLTKGEVYLEVAQGKDKFLVQTPTREVTALGTHFAVREQEKGTGVVVTQGKVDINGKLIQTGQRIEPGESTVQPAPRASHLLHWTRELMTAADAPLVPASKHAGGALLAIDPNGQEVQLSLRKYHIDVHIEDGFARTTIDQTYFNNEWSRLEGTFYFPLPADATLSRLAMYVEENGQCRLMEGGMAEREHARTVFETIMHTRRDPALLEWVDGTTFKMRVFPLEGRKEKRIILSYTQRLSDLYGSTRYRFPGGSNMAVVRDWSFQATIHKGAKLNLAAEPNMTITTVGKNAVLTARATNIKPDRDVSIEMRGSAGARERGSARFSEFTHEKSKYLMVRFRPELAGKAQRQRRDWVVLFESSANRDPLVARAQIDLVRHMLLNAEHDDMFVLLTANTKVHAFDQKARPATPKNIDEAVKFLESTHLIGALDLDNALKTAKPFLESVENPHFVHVGAGLASLGENRDEVLVERVPDRTRYIGLGVGKRWNRSFMKLAAERSAGYYRQVNPDESLAWHGFDLLATLNTPRLLDVRVADKAGKATFLSETTMLSQGEEICAITRIGEPEALPKEITVSGKIDGKRFSQTLEVRGVAGDAGYLPRAWAKLELDRLQADGAEKNKQRIIELSKASYVMSPFTSLLVLETDADYERFKVDRGRKDHWALYPCPDRIPIVYEPGNQVVNQPANDKDGKKPVAEVLQTLLVRVPPQVLRHPQDSYTFGSHCLNVGYLYSGAYGFAYEVPDEATVDLGGLRTWTRSGRFTQGRVRELAEVWGALPRAERSKALSDLTFDLSPRHQQAIRNYFRDMGVRKQSEALMSLEAEGFSNDLAFFPPALGLTIRRPGPLGGFAAGGSIVGRFRKTITKDTRLWLDTYDSTWDLAESLQQRINPRDLYNITVRATTENEARMESIPEPLAGMFWGRPGATFEYYKNHGYQINGWWAGDDGKRIQFAPVFVDPTMRWAVPDPWAPAGGIWAKEKGLSQLVDRFPANELLGEDWDDFALVDMAFKKDIARKWRRMQRPDSLLYHRPMFTGDQALFSDLTIYAPGLNTTPADIQSVLEAEAKQDRPIIQGKVDRAAKALIDKARSAGWQQITIPGARGLTIHANGAGQYVFERMLWSGLREMVVCDGKTLRHLYPEIGLGSKREVSRRHRAEFAGLVPWSVPPVHDLARGADIKLVSANTVALVPPQEMRFIRTPPSPQGKNETNETKSNSLKRNENAIHVHLVFGDNGRLRERRMVLMPEKKTIYREVYRPGGTVVWFDAQDRQLAELKLTARSSTAPSLTPDVSRLVLVPMPMRTPHAYQLKLNNLTDYTKQEEDFVISVIASNCWQQNWPHAQQAWQQRFHSQGDRRLGFYTLLTGSQYRPSRKEDNHDGKEPLFRYLSTMPQPTEPLSPRESADIGPKDSFLQRLATIREYWLFFGGNTASLERNKKLQTADAFEFLQDCPAPFAFALLAVIQDKAGRGPIAAPQSVHDAHRVFLKQLAEQYGRLADHPALGYAARYEQARCLNNSLHNNTPYRKLYAEGIKDGAIPIVDSAFPRAFAQHYYDELMLQTAAQFMKQKRFAAVLTLAWQNNQLGQHGTANDLVSTALAKVSGWQKPFITLGGIDFLMHTNKLAQADSALQGLLADEKLADNPGLWRLAAEIAQKRGITSRAAQCLEKALDIEYRDLPDVINLKKVREDYTTLLTHYHQLAVALSAIETAPPKNFVARVVRAADRWRALDQDSTQACQLAAKTLQAIGARDLAWDYLTTPVSLKPNESGPWLDLARAMVETDFNVADRAFALAFKAEPTNAQILWDHAQALDQHGRLGQAQQLYHQLAETDWQPRFQNLRQQARLKLEQ